MMGCRAEQARKQEATSRAQAQEQRQVAEELADKYRNLSYIHGVALADSKYHEGNLRNARQLLKSCPEHLRNWEWYRLNYVMDEALLTFGPEGYVFVLSIAVSPDGKYIASANAQAENWTITIWEAASGSEIVTLGGHKSPIHSIAYSPDGKRIVSGSFDGTIKVWDASNGDELMTLPSDGALAIAFSPDGKTIAGAGGPGKGDITLWESGPRAVVGGSEKLVGQAPP